ncbi:hypothetical protein [Streptomyces aurantiogriseus]|uniref:Uncharacterized protein n=1 Tax=Streptomyces aurantiogriseus TaxID=66870 RepID=A0A918FFV6_9ACTN|nr:hypothetical protein [Streptomyces aurantiogriseus]GGR35290.1 hypothetical protein GCM10010251_59470 [Streptomyces aurantiogriseus]
MTDSTAERLSLLEAQVQVLAQAVRALAGGLEEGPSQDTEREKQAARGARLAHELLLSQGL